MSTVDVLSRNCSADTADCRIMVENESNIEISQPLEKIITQVKENTNGDSETTPGGDKTPMSKRQLKKLKKLAEWEIKKKEKRLKEREKYKQKKAEAIAKGLPIRTSASRKELKRNTAEKSDNFLKVIVDLDYDDLMIDKDVAKCVKQLLRIYTINRRSKHPARLYFAGIKENGRVHKCLERNDGYQNWDVSWHYEPYTSICDKSKIVFLTSDSDNVLKELEKDTYYVIGGIVDHNHHKGLCLDRAEKLGLRTARLPLNEYVDIKTRTVLSTVHVFDMLLNLSMGKAWQDTILDILPMRKGAKAKEATENNCQNKSDDSLKESESSLEVSHEESGS